MRPFINARRVNSPASAGRAPSRTRRRHHQRGRRPRLRGCGFRTRPRACRCRGAYMTTPMALIYGAGFVHRVSHTSAGDFRRADLARPSGRNACFKQAHRLRLRSRVRWPRRPRPPPVATPTMVSSHGSVHPFPALKKRAGKITGGLCAPPAFMISCSRGLFQPKGQKPQRRGRFSHVRYHSDRARSPAASPPLVEALGQLRQEGRGCAFAGARSNSL